MVNAYRDENSVPTLIGVSEDDGDTILRVKADPTNHGVKVNDGTTGVDNGNNNGNAMHDENNVVVLLAVSSADGQTPIEVYIDSSNGGILVDSS